MEEAEIVFDFRFVADDDTAELCEPGEEPFDFPASFIAPQGASVLCQPFPSFSMRRDHFDAVLAQQTLIQGIAVVGFVADHPAGYIIDETGVDRLINQGYFIG